MGWKRCCLRHNKMPIKLLTIVDFWMEWFYFFWGSMLHDASDQVSAEEHIWFWRSCLKTSKKAVYCMTIFDILVEWKKHLLVYLWSDLSHQVSAHEDMVWRKILFDAFQDGYLVDGYLWYLNKIIKAILVLHLPWRLPSILCWKENMGWKLLFEEFQDGCLVHGHLWYRNWRI